MIAAITPAIDITNRRSMRKYVNQALKPANELQTVVDGFINAMFHAPENITYSVIYDHYFEEWKKACTKIKKKKPATVHLNPDFFEQNFSPAV